MPHKILFFAEPSVLSLKNEQLICEQHPQFPALSPTTTLTCPVEDLAMIVLENQRISLTVPLLTCLTQNNVSVVICDSKKMPSSLLLPLESNSTQQESYRFQVEATEPCKKQIWKQLITAKIRNQANLLSYAGKNADLLKPLYQTVKSGDMDNREGAAARLYWKELLGPSFVRLREGPLPNAWLNYGYSILRAATARALLSSGLLPLFGIFHRNRYNAFPLADDVMEPYRPFVDKIVYQMYQQALQSWDPECPEEPPLDKARKAQLLSCLYCDVLMDKTTRPLSVALSYTTSSITKYYKGETSIINLPILPWYGK